VFPHGLFSVRHRQQALERVDALLDRASVRRRTAPIAARLAAKPIERDRQHSAFAEGFERCHADAL
jgi:hypothetical protein